MLPTFLPSWLLDFSDTGAFSRAIELLHGSLLPLLLVLPVAVIALLLMDRNGAPATEAPPPGPDSQLNRRSALPAQRRSVPAPDVAARQQPLPPKLEAALVLVADDSAVVRGKLSRLLGSAGFRVVTVGDGQQALDLIDDGEVPSVLITDLEMPALDGFELIAALHGAIRTEQVPIIAITGHDDLQARVADLTGVYGIFKKPWNDRELIRRVEALVNVARTQRAIV